MSLAAVNRGKLEVQVFENIRLGARPYVLGEIQILHDLDFRKLKLLVLSTPIFNFTIGAEEIYEMGVDTSWAWKLGRVVKQELSKLEH